MWNRQAGSILRVKLPESIYVSIEFVSITSSSF
eukprot:COSAG06_NODE_46571_length_346_cov_0.578947_2_plen_32_part_01